MIKLELSAWRRVRWRTLWLESRASNGTKTNASKFWNSEGIDFIDAAKVLLGTVYDVQSSRHGEVRHVAIGPLENGPLIAVVYPIRGTKLRIITARRARHDEQIAYDNAVSTASNEGANRSGSRAEDDG